MTHKSQTPNVERTASFLGDIVRQIGLVWRLLTDTEVPLWVKIIPPLAILYVIFPIDLVPDFAPGLGQIDDLAVLLIGLKLFIEMSPKGLVQRYRDELAGNPPPAEPEGEVVDADYRVVDDK